LLTEKTDLPAELIAEPANTEKLRKQMQKFTKAMLSLRGQQLFPGLTLVLTIAAAANFMAEHYGAPVMLFALLIGIAFNFLADDSRCRAGIEFASNALLRIGIVLLGARITLADISSIGLSAFVTVIGLIIMTIGFGLACALLLKRSWSFGLLTGGAVAICGASAALAIASIMPNKDQARSDVLFTVVSVTTLSTVAMVLYPLIFSYIGLSDRESGFLIGATIHDVAQVVGAGYSISTEAGDIATIVKLLRVATLPLVLLLIIVSMARSSKGSAKARVPLFVVGFAVVMLANSAGFLGPWVATAAAGLSSWLLIIAISALGVKTNIRAMARLGWRHVAIVVAETLFLLVLAGAALASGKLF